MLGWRCLQLSLDNYSCLFLSIMLSYCLFVCFYFSLFCADFLYIHFFWRGGGGEGKLVTFCLLAKFSKAIYLLVLLLHI